MNTFFRFLYEFLNVFFHGIYLIFNGIFSGIVQMFNFSKYAYYINFYKNDFTVLEWIFVFISIIVLVVIIVLACILFYFLIRKYIFFRKKAMKEEDLLAEIANLNNQINKLANENKKLIEMNGFDNVVSSDSIIESSKGDFSSSNLTSDSGMLGGKVGLNGESEHTEDSKYRFSKLHAVDLDYENYKVANYGNGYNLEELVENFRNFSASKLHLYYSEKMIRVYISALASTKLVILQGISGTGKTSLGYAWGKFINKDAGVVAVQPSWKEKSDLLGYFNEFTKVFNETDFLKFIYEADYTDDVSLIILDEMNISRVEYYFAEVLSVLEIPNPEEWYLEIVPNSWPNDPVLLKNGKVRIPENMWYIGTINNDDSTFEITDKVYDRAMPIDINDKCKPFEAKETESMNLNFSYLNNLFKDALSKYDISDEMLDKISQLDDYVIHHFRIAFGNRIVKQLHSFVATYVACGGTEVDAIDYYLARKVIYKFERLNLNAIRDEIQPFIKFLNSNFGENNFTECKEILNRILKS